MGRSDADRFPGNTPAAKLAPLNDPDVTIVNRRRRFRIKISLVLVILCLAGWISNIRYKREYGHG